MERGTPSINTEANHAAAAAQLSVGEKDSNNADAKPPFIGRARLDMEGNLKFDPPLYRQRYEAVRDILKDGRWVSPIESVVEFGCAELAMFDYFKHICSISKILMVDIDKYLLEDFNCRAGPLTSDYLNPRSTPLHVEVLCGSVADCDQRVLGADAVVCIELIEHLEKDIVDELEKTIFGFIEPKIAIFTTPNSDFNVLLKGLEEGKFRHYDHKFEWSRSEFSDWTSKIICEYPHYSVETSGVGMPPAGHEEVGFCSQLALFIRSDDYKPLLDKDAKEIYCVSRIYDHPVKAPDLRTDHEKLIDEIQFHLQRLAFYDCYQNDYKYSHIPLGLLTNLVKSAIPDADIESIRSALTHEVIEKDGILYVVFEMHSRPGSSFLSDEHEDNNKWDEEENIQNDSVHEGSTNEEIWDDDPPPFDENSLVEYHLNLATYDNAMNSMYERIKLAEAGDLYYVGDSYEEDDVRYQLDCERIWNSSPPLEPVNYGSYDIDPGAVEQSDGCNRHRASTPLSPSDVKDCHVLNSKPEPITDSGVDLSPLLNRSCLQDERHVYECGKKIPTNIKASGELPKSTSVEVLHLDGSCTLRRPAGLEYVEFSPSTSVALCYTGQTYSHCDKFSAGCSISLSSERKSLDGSLVRDAADSCSLDLAGDSGYPNSSSLHHDVYVDLTPEQVDDISSENGERSNQSLSDDDMSDSSDRAPAFPRRLIHPRRPVVPIVIENVENGDLANNNRDGEGNNAVAAQGDEREFVALVHEGEMQPLFAAPVLDDVILPNNADPFPYWLVELIRVVEEDRVPVKMADELERDEGLGEDT